MADSWDTDRTERRKVEDSLIMSSGLRKMPNIWKVGRVPVTKLILPTEGHRPTRE